ncbi:hypothetical protein [Sphingomonas sp.]|uniref:hypothetical protein n=1 Tax=Sphingomonas sp. TaxID=28214 RepID=UPI002FC73BE8
MSEPKPFASLSSGLLARKGAAKPAMRPQGFGHMGAGLDDLGWNDMGHAPSPVSNAFAYPEEPLEHVPSSITALTPAPRPAVREPEDVTEEPTLEAPVFEPPVFEQQRAIAESFGAESFGTQKSGGEKSDAEDVQQPAPATPVRKRETSSAGVVSLPRRPRQAAGAKDKAAFTLRLDRDRHLKLRLACAVTHRSAQQIVSEALDIFLDALPELEALTGKLPTAAHKRN